MPATACSDASPSPQPSPARGEGGIIGHSPNTNDSLEFRNCSKMLAVLSRSDLPPLPSRERVGVRGNEITARAGRMIPPTYKAPLLFETPAALQYASSKRRSRGSDRAADGRSSSELPGR